MSYRGFPIKAVPLLRCQKDGGALRISTSEEFVQDCELLCVSCGEKYFVRRGIADFKDKQGKLSQILDTEVEARDREAGSYDRHFVRRVAKELKPTVVIVGSLNNATVIEFGAGTGRFTEVLSREAASYLAVDFSRNSLELLKEKAIGESVALILGNAINFKAAKSCFDRVLAFQVIEHMPTQAERDVFYSNTVNSLKETGSFVFSVYHQDLRRIMARKNPEGRHGDGIFYHYFSQKEFGIELQKHFRVDILRPIDITLPFESRLGLPLWFGGVISGISEMLPLANRFGHLLIAKGQRPFK